jgi:hypothetical protein
MGEFSYTLGELCGLGGHAVRESTRMNAERTLSNEHYRCFDEHACHLRPSPCHLGDVTHANKIIATKRHEKSQRRTPDPCAFSCLFVAIPRAHATQWQSLNISARRVSKKHTTRRSKDRKARQQIDGFLGALGPFASFVPGSRRRAKRARSHQQKSAFRLRRRHEIERGKNASRKSYAGCVPLGTSRNRTTSQARPSFSISQIE